MNKIFVLRAGTKKKMVYNNPKNARKQAYITVPRSIKLLKELKIPQLP